MTTVVIEEAHELSGRLEAPPSKSYTHRAVIAASLAPGASRICNALLSEDTAATVTACSALGAQITHHDRLVTVVGTGELHAPAGPIDCRESASTLRFLTPIAALAEGITVLTGSPGLKRRPIEPLLRALHQLGVTCTSSRGFPPVSVVGGGIPGGYTSLVGNVTSQFISGLLFACPRAAQDTTIEVTTPLESKPYVELTRTLIEKHGVAIRASQDLRRFDIAGGQHYQAQEHLVPGDFSSAAFLLAAAALTPSNIVVSNLHSPMPDDEILTLLRRMQGRLRVQEDVVEVEGADLSAIDIDARDIPDLVMPCAILACCAEGETRIYHAQRLRLKESNRLAALSTELTKMGADIRETRDGLRIRGPCALHGATVTPHNDHRIAMACAVAGLRAAGHTVILNAECVNKSYPTFFEDLRTLGAKIRVQ
jgi:3-phosphoshikimate 1-carboxyvinyltransferase